MSSRALILAAVAICIGNFATTPARAQNLDSGKSSSQIFSSTCSLCHKSSRGMLKTVAPGALPGFLRQHYTTSTNMAAAMSAFVLSNGAADTRVAGDSLTKQGQESRTAPKPSVTPDAGPEPSAKQGRRTREAARTEASRPDAKRPDSAPSPGQSETRPDVGGLEPIPGAAPEVAEKPEASKPDLAKPDPRQKSAKSKGGRGEARSAALNPEPSKDETRPDAARSAPDSATRSDPVPAVTPAPKEPENQKTAAQDFTPGSSVLTIDHSPVMALPAQAAASRAPAGPPVPPISQ